MAMSRAEVATVFEYPASEELYSRDVDGNIGLQQRPLLDFHFNNDSKQLKIKRKGQDELSFVSDHVLDSSENLFESIGLKILEKVLKQENYCCVSFGSSDIDKILPLTGNVNRTSKIHYYHCYHKHDSQRETPKKNKSFSLF